jgi:hypothetical protein
MPQCCVLASTSYINCVTYYYCNDRGWFPIKPIFPFINLKHGTRNGLYTYIPNFDSLMQTANVESTNLGGS